MDKSNLFKNIVDQYTAKLYNRAYYLLSDVEEAEDIVQEVFISAYKSYDSFKENSSIKTWLFTILKYKIADYYRKKYKNTTTVRLDQYFDEDGLWKKETLLIDWSNDEVSIINNPDFKSTFDRCIENLPEKWKIPIKLYYLEERKTDQLSQELGITTTNIWKILQRGRLQLKDCLENNWFNHL